MGLRFVFRTVAAVVGSLVLCGVAGCSSGEKQVVASEPPPSTVAPFEGPSGLEQESEDAARAVVAEQQRLEVEAAAEAARIAAEAAERERQRAETAAAAARAAAVAEREAQESVPDDYVGDDREFRCSEGTATVEECFGPGSDLNGNGVADINE